LRILYDFGIIFHPLLLGIYLFIIIYSMHIDFLLNKN
jgi:hypothetical protein